MNANGHEHGTTPEVAAIRTRIDDAREQIAASLIDLRRDVMEAADWQEWFRRRPFLFLTAAFGLGLFLGTRRLLRRRE